MNTYVEFVEAPAFTRHLPKYLDDDEYHLLQMHLARNPDAGAVIPGTGGFRKLRWADTRRGKGRRGGLRVIYYYFMQDRQIFLMTLYGKDEATDLTAKQRNMLKSAVESELAERRANKAPRRRK